MPRVDVGRASGDLMGQFLNLSAFLRALQRESWGRVAFEMLLIGLVVFWIIRFLRGTRGARLLKGITLVLIGLFIMVRLLGAEFELTRVGLLFEKFFQVAAIAIIVVFQPELRRALMRLGETRLFRSWTIDQVDEEIGALIESATFCSRRKIGALIALERGTPLSGLAEEARATRLNAELSAALLNTIFFPNTELHDLGVIISQGRIAYAGVQFPMAEGGDLERELGARHRAGVGLSQETDAIVLIVSEETGDISIAERGRLIRKLTADALAGLLSELLAGVDDEPFEKKKMSNEPYGVQLAPGSN
jgi:diadenylate cyclase